MIIKEYENNTPQSKLLIVKIKETHLIVKTLARFAFIFMLTTPTLDQLPTKRTVFCTYFYPDNPDDDDRRIKGKYSSAIANPTNHGFVQQKPTMMGSNKSCLLSTCEDSSFFCTYSYLDHSFAGRKIKSNYTPVVPTIDAVWNDVCRSFYFTI